MPTNAPEPEARDPLLEAASRVFAARQADKFAVWLALAAAGVGLVVLMQRGWQDEWWALGALGIGAALVWRVGRVVIYRVHGLGSLPLFGGDIHAKTLTPAPPSDRPLPSWVETAPRSASVPRLAFQPEVAAHAVVTANVVNTATLRGGLPDVDHDDLPMGVFLVTERGLAFLPGDQGRLEGIIGDLPAGMVMEVAGMAFTPIDVFNRLQTIDDFERRPTLGEWLREALGHRHAFVIPWGNLTGVLAGGDTMVLTRETADGTRSDHVVLDGSRIWPTFLMQQRIVSDLKEATFARLIRPKIDALLPEVFAERQAGGQPTDDDSVRLEAVSRALAWFTEELPPETGPVVRDALAPALEGYAILPKIVENQPWLFEDPKDARSPEPKS